jgi:hypothetical protein
MNNYVNNNRNGSSDLSLNLSMLNQHQQQQQQHHQQQHHHHNNQQNQHTHHHHHQQQQQHQQHHHHHSQNGYNGNLYQFSFFSILTFNLILSF